MTVRSCCVTGSRATVAGVSSMVHTAGLHTATREIAVRMGTLGSNLGIGKFIDQERCGQTWELGNSLIRTLGSNLGIGKFIDQVGPKNVGVKLGNWEIH